MIWYPALLSVTKEERERERETYFTKKPNYYWEKCLGKPGKGRKYYATNHWENTYANQKCLKNPI